MNREEARPATRSHRLKNGRSSLWEHHQIDIMANDLPDGERVIHIFRDWGIEILAIGLEGTVIDFRAVSLDGTPIQLTLPPFDLSSESYGPYRHSLVHRSWDVPSLGLTIHVESWVEKGRGGFIDVFTRSAGEG